MHFVVSERPKVETVFSKRPFVFDSALLDRSQEQFRRVLAIELIHKVAISPIIIHYTFQVVQVTDSLIHAHRVTSNGGVIAFKPGNSTLDFGTLSPVKAMPTAPDECTFPLRNNVVGLPVMNGVEDAIRPSLIRKLFSTLISNTSSIHEDE